MNLLNELGEIGGEILDTTGQIIGGIGDDISNRSEADKVMIDRNKALIDIERAKAAQKIKSQQENQKILKISISVTLGLIALLIGAKIYKDLK